MSDRVNKFIFPLLLLHFYCLFVPKEEPHNFVEHFAVFCLFNYLVQAPLVIVMLEILQISFGHLGNQLGFKHAPNSFDLHRVKEVKVLVKVLVGVINPKVIVAKRSQV